MIDSPSSSLRLAARVVLALGLTAPIAAQEQEQPKPPAQAPAIGSSPSRLSGKKPRSLAEVARDIKLARPQGGSLVISDATLGQLAGEGHISVAAGGGAPPEQRAQATALPQPASPRAEWEKSYEEQVKAVKEAEEKAKGLDQARNGAHDPYQPDMGAYSHAPGAVSRLQSQQEEAARQLQAEREKLARLKEEGRRLGVTPEQPPRQPGSTP